MAENAVIAWLGGKAASARFPSRARVNRTAGPTPVNNSWHENALAGARRPRPRRRPCPTRASRVAIPPALGRLAERLQRTHRKANRCRSAVVAFPATVPARIPATVSAAAASALSRVLPLDAGRPPGRGRVARPAGMPCAAALRSGGDGFHFTNALDAEQHRVAAKRSHTVAIDFAGIRPWAPTDAFAGPVARAVLWFGYRGAVGELGGRADQHVQGVDRWSFLRLHRSGIWQPDHPGPHRRAGGRPHLLPTPDLALPACRAGRRGEGPGDARTDG